jgi:cell volume regulation protein A
MNEIVTFGVLVLAAASGAALLLASSQITARLALPAPAFFLLAAAAASNALPAVGDALSIRSVERIAVVALIVILFDGGLKVGWQRLRGSLLPIGLLGVAGTAGTGALLALCAHHLFGFDWILAGILGAALAPTDPAVMFSVLRGRQIGGRARTVLEGESGINDPVSIALVVGLLEYARGADGSLLVVAREFAAELAIGAAVGAAIGSVLPFLLRHARFASEGLYSVAALVAAAIAYGAASVAHGSGFLAVFVSGVLLGAERTPHKGEIERFSGALASFAEMAVFAALGLTIDLASLADRRIWLDGILLALLLGLVVRPLVVLPLLAPLRLRRGERLFIAWAGLKGAVPILLAALAVLAGFESQRMYGIVFIVALFSVVVQGGSVQLAAQRFAIPRRSATGTGHLLGGRRLRRYRVADTARGAETAVRDLPLGRHGWVDEIVRGDRVIDAHGRDVVRGGDELLVSVDDERAADSVERLVARPRPERAGADARGEQLAEGESERKEAAAAPSPSGHR